MGQVSELVALAHATARGKGFHDDTPGVCIGSTPEDARAVLSWLMLIGTEVAEAAEAVRRGDAENFAEELADVVIRVFDTAGALGVDLERAILAKMDTNRERPPRHGKLV